MIEEPTVARAYTECYVAFIDILGFRKKVEESLLVPSTLNDLVKALEIKPPAQVTTVANPEGDGNWEWWRLQIRAFSDSIVIFLPSKTQRLSLIFYTARYLYDRMLELGLCVRGAITIGDMYWDKSWDPPRGGGSIAGEARADNRKPTITLGPGMINAYELESKRAKFPRILVSDELYQHIETFQPKLYPLMKFGTAGRKLTEFIREDIDGLYFFDFLHYDIDRDENSQHVREKNEYGKVNVRWVRDKGGIHGGIMKHVENLLHEGLVEKELSEEIRDKYRWLKSYVTSVLEKQ